MPAPHRRWPGSIIASPRNDMHMQLPDDITKRGDIHLIGAEGVLDGLGSAVASFHSAS